MLFPETGFGYRLAIGYLHSFLGGPIYDASGHRLPNLGLPNAMPLLELGGGLNLNSRGPLQSAPFIRLVAFGRFPFNGTILPRAAIEVGTNLRWSGPVDGGTS